MKYKILQNKFFHITMIFTILCLLAVSIALSVLWNFLLEYDKSDPKGALTEYIELIKQDKFVEAMALAQVKEDGFLTASEYKNYVKRTIGEDFNNLIITQTPSEDVNKKLYNIVGEGKEHLSFELIEQKDTLKFGLSSYKIKQDPIKTVDYTVNVYGIDSKDIKINSKDSSEFLTDKATPVEIFTGIKDKKLIPNSFTYKVNGLIGEPVIEIININKEDYTIEKTGDFEYTIVKYASKDKYEEQKQAAILASQKYANFISKDYTLGELSSLFLTNSEFYSALTTFSNYWYIVHDSFDFKNLNVSNMKQYSPNHYTCEVKFDYIIKKGSMVNTYPTKYELAIIKVNGQYKVANIKML